MNPSTTESAAVSRPVRSKRPAAARSEEEAAPRPDAPAEETEHAARPPSANRPLDFPIYKPNSRGSGGVIRFSLNRSKGAVFVDAASQCGEKQFDWERKITMKWSLSDLGAALATLQGRCPQAKLFHQSEKANSAFELVARDDPERAPYLMTLSRQDSADKSLKKVTIPVTHSEAALLETAFRTAIARMLAW